MSEILQLLGLRPNLRTEPTIQTYRGTHDPKSKPKTNDQKLNKYKFKHYYIAAGRNKAAERFLDQLNEHNNRSANATLREKEMNGPVLTEGMLVVNKTSEVDEEGDFLKIKHMANMNAGFCRTDDQALKIYHWQPDKKYPGLRNNDMEALFADKLVDRYVKLKKENNWIGWYYLFYVAFIDKKALKIYEVTDESGGKAYVPVMLHMPALTIQHTKPLDTSAPMTLTTIQRFKERVKRINLSETTTTESFKKDVKEINERVT